MCRNHAVSCLEHCVPQHSQIRVQPAPETLFREFVGTQLYHPVPAALWAPLAALQRLTIDVDEGESGSRVQSSRLDLVSVPRLRPDRMLFACISGLSASLMLCPQRHQRHEHHLTCIIRLSLRSEVKKTAVNETRARTAYMGANKTRLR